jgi:ParB family chromosome partitioning protein
LKIVELNIDLIDEDSEQPRRQFDKAAIDELAESIREVGLLTPIKVCKAKYGRYKIIFGNRRYKALKQLGFRKVPCILAENVDELDIYFEQLTENIQREGFTPVEEALGFEKLLDQDGRWKISKKYLSSRLGKTEKYIANKLSLLVFGPEVRKIIYGGAAIVPGKLTEEQALSLKDVPMEYRDQVALKVAKDGRSVKDVKRIAQLFMSTDSSHQLKERLMHLPCQELVRIAIENDLTKQQEKVAEAAKAEAAKAEAAKTEAPPAAVGDDGNPASDDEMLGNLIDNRPPVYEALSQRLAKLAAWEPLDPETVALLDELPPADRRKLAATVSSAVATMESRLAEWQLIKTILEK